MGHEEGTFEKKKDEKNISHAYSFTLLEKKIEVTKFFG